MNAAVKEEYLRRVFEAIEKSEELEALSLGLGTTILTYSWHVIGKCVPLIKVKDEYCKTIFRVPLDVDIVNRTLLKPLKAHCFME